MHQILKIPSKSAKKKKAYDQNKCYLVPSIKTLQIIQHILMKFLSVYSQDINPNSFIFTKACRS